MEKNPKEKNLKNSEKMVAIEKIREFSEKDSAWSFLILFAAFVCQVIIFGYTLCFGIYLVTLVDYFRASRSEAALVGSLAYGCMCLAGPIASVGYRKFGCRYMIMTGSLIASGGMLLSYLARNLSHLYVTYGVLGGFGLGLVYTPTLGILPDYFDRFRYFATAAATIGAAVGTLLFSPIFYFLIEIYSLRGSFLINGGICLNLFLCGSLMKSRNFDRNLRFSSLWEFALLKDGRMWLLAATCGLWAAAIYIMFSMINSLAIFRGLSLRESTFLVSIIGFCNIGGRLAAAVIGQYPKINHVIFYALSTLAFSICIFCAVACRNFLGFAFVCGIFGFGFGAMLSQLPGVAMDLFGIRRLVNALGYSLFSCGIGALVVPPIAARITDAFGVEAAFYFAGGCSLAAAILGFFIDGLNTMKQQAAKRSRANEAEIE